MTDLGPPAAEAPRSYFEATDINQGGQVVLRGFINSGTNPLWGGFVGDDGVLSPVGGERPTRINNAGQVVGETRVARGVWNARLWEPIDCPEQP